MFNTHHATDYEVPEGCEYPIPLCGQAGFDRDLLLPFDTFTRLADNDESDLCWECRSILS